MQIKKKHVGKQQQHNTTHTTKQWIADTSKNKQSNQYSKSVEQYSQAARAKQSIIKQQSATNEATNTTQNSMNKQATGQHRKLHTTTVKHNQTGRNTRKHTQTKKLSSTTRKHKKLNAVKQNHKTKHSNTQQIIVHRSKIRTSSAQTWAPLAQPARWAWRFERKREENNIEQGTTTKHKEINEKLIVCLFVCLLVCLFVLLFACLLVGWLVGWLVCLREAKSEKQQTSAN